jgi:hypothetical protein
MTKDNCFLFDLSDIRNIQFECKKCQSRFVTPIVKWTANPAFCPNCKEPWLKTDGNIQEAISGLKACLQKLLGNEKEVEFKVRFEVTGPGNSN